MYLAFVITTHRGDSSLAHRLLWQLGTHHPRAQKIVITDGVLEDWQTRALESMCDHLERGEALGRDTSRPTAWLERMLRVALEFFSAEVVVKLDPDAYLTRAIRGYPASDLFGSLCAGSVVGVYGFRRSLAEAILEGRILERPELQLVNHSSANLVFEDEQISRAVGVLGGRVEHWDEVCSRARPTYHARDLSERYALWHPFKGSLEAHMK